MQLVSVLADLGDGRLSADHRHDPLVVVVEGLGHPALHASDDVLCRPVACLLRNAAELRKRVIASGRDVREVAERVHVRGDFDSQVGLNVEAPAATRRTPDWAESGAAMSPPPQTVRCVLSVVPSLNVT